MVVVYQWPARWLVWSSDPGIRVCIQSYYRSLNSCRLSSRSRSINSRSVTSAGRIVGVGLQPQWPVYEWIVSNFNTVIYLWSLKYYSVDNHDKECMLHCIDCMITVIVSSNCKEYRACCIAEYRLQVMKYYCSVQKNLTLAKNTKQSIICIV